ncbi:glycosyltransferase family 4 protein, partial [Leptolyngbya cf. ectocarpi LEGE 11479]
VQIFSLRHPLEQDTYPDMAKVKAPVTYLPSLLPTFNQDQEKELINAQVELFEQNSETYVQTLKLYLNRDQDQKYNEFLQGGCLAWKLQNLGITHLHAHFAGLPAATVEIAQAFSGVSYSMTVHTQDIYLSDKALLDRRMAKAEFIVTCSEHNRQYLERISTSETPIHMAYHGIDINCFSPRPRTQSLDVPLILSAGRLCENSGFSYLLKACHLLKQKDISFNCKIIGDGPSKDFLQQQINELGLGEHVILLDELSQEQLIEYYQQATLFVLPYLVNDNGERDGIPSVLLEAMAMELPVVSTHILGISELIQSHYNGILVTEKDSLSLAQALESLLIRLEFGKTLGKTSRLIVLDKFGLTSNVSVIKDSLLRATEQLMGSYSQSHILENWLRLAAS